MKPEDYERSALREKGYSGNQSALRIMSVVTRTPYRSFIAAIGLVGFFAVLLRVSGSHLLVYPLFPGLVASLYITGGHGSTNLQNALSGVVAFLVNTVVYTSVFLLAGFTLQRAQPRRKESEHNRAVKNINWGEWLKWTRIMAASLALAWLVCSARLVKPGWDQPLPRAGGFLISNIKVQQALAWAVWTAVPPLWFLFEHWIFRRTNRSEGEIEAFKYGQDLASKLWIAIAAVLLALYFGKDLKGEARAPDSAKPQRVSATGQASK